MIGLEFKREKEWRTGRFERWNWQTSLNIQNMVWCACCAIFEVKVRTGKHWRRQKTLIIFGRRRGCSIFSFSKTRCGTSNVVNRMNFVSVEFNGRCRSKRERRRRWGCREMRWVGNGGRYIQKCSEMLNIRTSSGRGSRSRRKISVLDCRVKQILSFSSGPFFQ